MLKLNLLLNGLVSSLDNAIQGDTLVNPYHKSDDEQNLRSFDYIVSNPPFKLPAHHHRQHIYRYYSASALPLEVSGAALPSSNVTFAFSVTVSIALFTRYWFLRYVFPSSLCPLPKYLYTSEALLN